MCWYRKKLVRVYSLLEWMNAIFYSGHVLRESECQRERERKRERMCVTERERGEGR